MPKIEALRSFVQISGTTKAAPNGYDALENPLRIAVRMNSENSSENWFNPPPIKRQKLGEGEYAPKVGTKRKSET